MGQNLGDRPSYGAMVERRDGPSWLRDDDDDELGYPAAFASPVKKKKKTGTCFSTGYSYE